MNICNVISQKNGDLEITDARLLYPGDSGKPILVQRMKRRDAYGMPPAGIFTVNEDGTVLLEAWITAMGETCP